MKKLIFFLAAAAMAVSCNLDKFPVDKVSSGDMKNPESAANATAGVYAMFKSPVAYNGFYTVGNTYIRHYSQMAELKADNTLMSGKSTDPLFSDATLVEMAGDTNLEYFWLISYKICYAATVIIDVIPEDTEDATLRHIRGENLFMRAYSHMNLINIFSYPYSLKGPDEIGVVIRTAPASTGEESKRATVGEVYASVESDLKAAIKCMEGGARRGDNGYIDVNAAKGLLCRLYLYMKRYDECIALADELLGGDGHSLLEDDVEHLYQFTRTSKEVLWCVAVEDNTNDYPGAQAMMGSMYNAFGRPSEGQDGDPGDGTGWAEIYYSQPLIDLFNRYPTDQRYVKMHTSAHASKDGKKMIYWPVVNPDGFAENYIDREPSFNAATGKYSCKDANGKQYTVETEIVNTYPKTYIMLNGTKQYVTVADSMGCRTGTGGDMYPLNYNKKFSYQDGGLNNLCSPAQIRYAEIILDRAEAYAHKNDAKALDDVNTIRKRAGIPSAGMFTTGNMKERGYETLLDVVLDERRMELCFEGFRMTDLQRNGKSIDRRYAGRQPYEVVAPDDPRLRYWIPLNEINASGLQQNTR